MWAWILTAALAGYGDAQDGYPSYDERDMHMWTNAVRVDPEAFRDQYGCWSQFEPSERTPKPPMAHNHGLNEAARFHNDDMYAKDYFDHTSADGTSMFERVARFYAGGATGENIAAGYSSTYSTVVQGWMCSAGHRSNIMYEAWDEYGNAFDNGYATQNFGYRGIRLPVMSMGLHRPAAPTNGQAEFLVDVYADSPPSRVDVVLDGEAVPLERVLGDKAHGVYAATLGFDGTGCHAYWFEADVDGTPHRFPEDGAYGFGDCEFDDAAAMWFSADTLAGPASPVPVVEGEEGPGGCAQGSPAAVGLLGMLGALGLRRRRRR